MQSQFDSVEQKLDSMTSSQIISGGKPHPPGVEDWPYQSDEKYEGVCVACGKNYPVYRRVGKTLLGVKQGMFLEKCFECNQSVRIRSRRSTRCQDGQAGGAHCDEGVFQTVDTSTAVDASAASSVGDVHQRAKGKGKGKGKGYGKLRWTPCSS